MAKSKKQIIDELDEHIVSRGGGYSSWYAGITESPKDRVFGDHKVDENKDKYAWRTAESDKIAREIEKHFLDLGCDGGPGGGDSDAKVVYVYKKSNRTDP